MIQARENSLLRFAALDVLLVAAACLVPAASHVLALPLYQLNPMLALLLAGMLVGHRELTGSDAWRNGLLLAVLMPLASSLLVGMPTAPKMVCMMAELATVAAMLGWLQKRWAILPAVLTAIVAGKVVYYGLKALVMAPAVLVGTDWKMQLLAVLLWGGLFALIDKRIKR